MWATHVETQKYSMQETLPFICFQNHIYIYRLCLTYCLSHVFTIFYILYHVSESVVLIENWSCLDAKTFSVHSFCKKRFSLTGIKRFSSKSDQIPQANPSNSSIRQC